MSRPEDVGSTLAQALAVVPGQGEDTLSALCRCPVGERLLLVVDNFGHVLDSAVLLAELHRTCPGLTILTTSREALRLAAERRYAVAPLALLAKPQSATAAELDATAAPAMFLAAARRHNAEFVLGSNAAPAIAGICARLDGLPLALELAAAHTALLGVNELAAQLDRAMSDQGVGARDAPDRHRTLHAAIDWSYRLLDERQREAFARFAVFAGGATIDAAEAVTGTALQTLHELAAKSLIGRREQPDGSTRLVMLETVRQYARQRLAENPDRNTARRCHLEHYTRCVEETAPQLMTRERDALAVLDREINNIRSALLWALQSAPASAVRLAGGLRRYWSIRPDPNSLHWLNAALDAAGDRAAVHDRAQAHLGRAYELCKRVEHRAALDAGRAALELYRQAGDHAGISEAYCELTTDAASPPADVDNLDEGRPLRKIRVTTGPHRAHAKRPKTSRPRPRHTSPEIVRKFRQPPGRPPLICAGRHH